MADSNSEKSIFLAAIEKPIAERAAFVDEATAGNVLLRARVQALLEFHDDPDSLLNKAVAQIATVDFVPPGPSAERVGALVGPYKLLEQLGGGGMGVVYMAEQLRPLRRKVALKIIKPGMDSGQVIARFEAERQALTMMDHPNIAKVLDAGTTDAGHPYFVMELVKGIPITTYCDQARLNTRERLELFILVCQAVQHAHQKGIIHRDIKPSNILVTLHDDKPVPKVIDFGIAKATGQTLTEKTLFTGYAQLLGTPLYMSPEQAQISGLDVDTRSDVYSLGVLLYELLTGTTPFDKRRLGEAAYDEMRRIIREEDPPNPSTRLSTMGDKIASVSALRHTEPKKLGQLVRGELDWIAMKSLEKDRSRRYETANGLASDVQRYLDDEAVQACPPSARYRFGKFARRNKAALTTAALLCIVLLLGTLISTWQAVRAHRARADAIHQADIARTEADKQEAVSAFLKEMLQAANPWAITAIDNFKGKDVTVLQVIDSAKHKLDAGALEGRPEIEAALRETIADTYASLGQNILCEAQEREALRLARAAYGPEHAQVAQCMVSLAWTMDGGMDRDNQPPARRAEAELLMRDGLAMQRRLLGNSDVVVQTMCSLCEMLLYKQKFVEAEQLARDALLIAPTSARPLGQLAEVLRKQGKPAEAEPLYRRAIAQVRQVKGDGNPGVWMLSRTLADSVADQGRFSEAEPIYREALKASRRTHSDEDPGVKLVVGGLTAVLRAQGKNPEAEAVLREHELAIRQVLIHQEPNSAELRKQLGDSLRLQGRLPEAELAYGDAIRLQPDMADAWAERGDCDRLTYQFAKMVEDYSQAIRLKPDTQRYWHERGFGYLQLGQHERAIADHSKSIEMGDQDWGQRLRRGDSYRALGELEKAEADYMRAAELNPAAWDCWTALAHVHARQHKPEKASEDLAAMLKLPLDPGAENAAAWILATDPVPETRNPVVALQLAEKAIAARPADGLIWNTVGVARYRNGRWRDAIAAFEKSMQFRNGGDSADWFFLAMCDWQLGDKDAAGKQYDQAVSWMDKNKSNDAELRGFRAEAEELLKRTNQPPTTRPSL